MTGHVIPHFVCSFTHLWGQPDLEGCKSLESPDRVHTRLQLDLLACLELLFTKSDSAMYSMGRSGWQRQLPAGLDIETSSSSSSEWPLPFDTLYIVTGVGPWFLGVVSSARLETLLRRYMSYFGVLFLACTHRSATRGI